MSSIVDVREKIKARWLIRAGHVWDVQVEGLLMTMAIDETLKWAHETLFPHDEPESLDMADARDIADEQHNDNNAEPDEGPEALDIRERNEQLASEEGNA